MYKGGGIVFQNVNFSFSSDNQILNNLSVVIPPNSFYSVIGESGIGKSTILSLLVNCIYIV